MGPHVSGRWPSGTASPMGLKYPASAALAWSATVLPTKHLLCSRRSLPFRILSSQQPGGHHHQAMDLFPDWGFVRLQNRATGKYVHAEGDWEKLTQRPDDGAIPSLNAVWRPPDQAFVSLRCCTMFLRANGRYLTWNNRITADLDRDAPRVSTMMQWTVRQVLSSPVPQVLTWNITLDDEGSDSALVFPHLARTIRHVRASDEGEFDQNHHNWPSFAFYDDDLIALKDEVGQLQRDWNGDVSAFTLCMRPGSHGRLMPLVTDLARSLDPVNIVVFKTGTPGAAALVYPAPPPPPPQPADAAAA